MMDHSRISSSRVENGAGIEFDARGAASLKKWLSRLLEEDIESVTSFTGSDYGHEEIPYGIDTDADDWWEQITWVPGDEYVFRPEKFFISDSLSLKGRSRFLNGEVTVSVGGHLADLQLNINDIDYYTVKISAPDRGEDALREYLEKYF